VGRCCCQVSDTDGGSYSRSCGIAIGKSTAWYHLSASHSCPSLIQVLYLDALPRIIKVERSACKKEEGEETPLLNPIRRPSAQSWSSTSGGFTGDIEDSMNSI
jgi:hypothetical protein